MLRLLRAPQCRLLLGGERLYLGQFSGVLRSEVLLLVQASCATDVSPCSLVHVNSSGVFSPGPAVSLRMFLRQAGGSVVMG